MLQGTTIAWHCATCAGSQSPRRDEAHRAVGWHHNVMDTSTQSDTRRSSPADRAARNGEHQDHQHEHASAGIDLPVFGHVPYKSVGFIAGLGLAGVAGVIEWPVAAAIGVGYALARRG